jgi:hypothetical protein
MGKPAQIDIVRRAYQLWQQAGEPRGRDEEFYHQAEKELQEALDKSIPRPMDKNCPVCFASAGFARTIPIGHGTMRSCVHTLA